MLDFREYKKVHDTLADVLPWAALVAPEVVLNKDGSFQSTFQYRGPDLDSSTDDERVVKAAHVNNVLRRLGTGWAIYAEAQLLDEPLLGGFKPRLGEHHVAVIGILGFPGAAQPERLDVKLF